MSIASRAEFVELGVVEHPVVIQPRVNCCSGLKVRATVLVMVSRTVRARWLVGIAGE